MRGAVIIVLAVVVVRIVQTTQQVVVARIVRIHVPQDVRLNASIIVPQHVKTIVEEDVMTLAVVHVLI